MLVLAIVLLAVSAGGLIYKANDRCGLVPLLLGLGGMELVLVGEFLLGFSLLVYIGLALLLIASLLTAWPRKKSGDHSRSNRHGPPHGRRDPMLGQRGGG